IDEITQRMMMTPEQFTAWFQLTFARIPDYWQAFKSEQSR
ncbi:isopentenyl-diphosphate Delta-isomerase, partial [Dickeya dadantii]|nr:isopentenyl-diphosphate Delta-isomerase [Dickeya dadantii]